MPGRSRANSMAREAAASAAATPHSQEPVRRQATQPVTGAQHRQQERLPQHHRAEAAGAVYQVPDGLRQPFMGEVESARGGLIGGYGRGRSGGIGKRIGRGQTVVGNDVLAGFEVPPEIGVGDLGGEKAYQQHGGKRQQCGKEPLGRKRRGRVGPVQTSSITPGPDAIGPVDRRPRRGWGSRRRPPSRPSPPGSAPVPAPWSATIPALPPRVP